MRLAQFWIPAMEAAGAAPDDPAQTATTLAEKMKAMLDDASAQALNQGFQLPDIQSALFAVVAWIDELAMTHTWAGTSAWRIAPLQRHYFSTTRAGTEFFERLEALPDENIEVREVYALMLLAGFNGRYSHRPAGELAGYRQKVLARVAQERTMAPLETNQLLFPLAGLEAKAPVQPTRNSGPSYPAFLLVALPLFCLLILYFFLNHGVDQQAAQLLGPLTAPLKP